MENENSEPVINLQDFPRQSSKLIWACEEWGCFRILNHDDILPVSLMAEMKEVVRTLLDLPTEIKKRNKDVIAGSGYMAPSEKNPLYEALGLFDMSSSEDVDEFCTQLGASPHQRETIKKYAAAINGLMMDIVRKMGEGLRLPNVSFEECPCQFRINKYHFTREAVGFLTILQDDENVGGLEVMKKSGEFVAVDPRPNTLLVTLGDIGRVWSNVRFYTVKHRVICKEAKIRVSIASFLLGPRDTAVEPPPE
ncbi:hypothetical protein K7X08_019957 [Anisodus acutangulus]|uniref:Uncharacterized protein n=1 Tax=Anisodus acutangulus TaxID=402998 RepID=A0A9Q1RQH6_9SOLA|nr:hypothetical protein K7X08_019957 [Anisodus acutangulus]